MGAADKQADHIAPEFSIKAETRSAPKAEVDLGREHASGGEADAGDGVHNSTIGSTIGRRNWAPLLWGGSGFVAGMLAWHVIGFWSFVSNVVLHADDPRAQTLEAFLPQLSASETAQKAQSPVSSVGRQMAQPVAKQAASEASLACVALSSDRGARGTSLSGCKGGASHLRDAGFNKRTDRLVLKPRLQDPVAWSGSTAVEITDAAPEPTRADPTNAGVAKKTASQSSGSEGAVGGDTSQIETGSLSDADLKLDFSRPGLPAAR